MRYHVEGCVWAMVRQRLEVEPMQLIDRREIAITESFTVLTAFRIDRLSHGKTTVSFLAAMMFASALLKLEDAAT